MLPATYPWIKPIGLSLIPMFFCLSGFLVAGSALRLQSLKVFLVFRVLRILPALLVEVSLSAIIMGGLLTSYVLKDYYTSQGFFRYFGNIVGHVQFYLPGVFEKHPMNIVNVNLWTLQPEFYCYGLMALLMMTGIIRRSTCYSTAFIFGSGVFFALIYAGYLPFEMITGVLVPHWVLVYCFLLGIVIYLNADYIPIHRGVFIVCVLLTYLFFSFQPTKMLAIFTVSYCTIYVGMTHIKAISWLPKGDYSYGMYLYGFPMGQLLWHCFPILRNWGAIAFCTLLVTLCFAIASWYLIEKRMLKLKRYFLEVASK